MGNFISLFIPFFLGVFFWTILEYTLHRFLGHKKHLKNVFTTEHLRHHREGDYFAPAYKKAIAALLVLAISTLILGLIFNWLSAFTFSFGLSLMYGVYEFLHKRAHTHAPFNFYGRWLRKHHFYHHFKNPKKNHGVTSPVWDIVFGTYVKPEKLRVPQKLVLPWLIDFNSHQILPKFSSDYELK